MSDFEDRAVDLHQSGAEAAGAATERGVGLAQTVRDAGADVARAAGDGAVGVARTAGDEVRQVGRTAAGQARDAGIDVRQRVREELDRQHRQVVGRVDTFAEQLDSMARERPDTPAGELVGMLAARSHSFAAYLDQHGPDQVLREVEDFARRRPGTFIVAALAAGFVAGRLGKGLWLSERERPA
jgi:hypothetical protein